MHRNVIETIMGGVVLIVAVTFLVFAYSSSSSGTVSGYQLTARFNNVSGINAGTDVRLSGIKVGSVVDTRLDPADYTALVSLSIKESVSLPTDTAVRVWSDGLLSPNYLDLLPGGDEKMLKEGDRIVHTQDPVNLLDLITKVIHGGGLDGKSGGGQTPPATTPSQ
jgi:phospholipid/cholesterol/gamma-HCH transport system substrate-binding protein